MDIHFTAQDQEFIRDRENRIKIKQEEQSHLLEKSLRFFKAVTEDDVETVKQTTSDPKLLTMISVILSDRIRITEKIREIQNGFMSLFTPEKKKKLMFCYKATPGSISSISLSLSENHPFFSDNWNDEYSDVISFCLKTRSVNCLKYFRDKGMFWNIFRSPEPLLQIADAKDAI